MTSLLKASHLAQIREIVIEKLRTRGVCQCFRCGETVNAAERFEIETVLDDYGLSTGVARLKHIDCGKRVHTIANGPPGITTRDGKFHAFDLPAPIQKKE